MAHKTLWVPCGRPHTGFTAHSAAPQAQIRTVYPRRAPCLVRLLSTAHPVCGWRRRCDFEALARNHPVCFAHSPVVRVVSNHSHSRAEHLVEQLMPGMAWQRSLVVTTVRAQPQSTRRAAYSYTAPGEWPIPAHRPSMCEGRS